MRSVVDRRSIKPCLAKEKDWPYLPEDVLQERLDARIRLEGDCWVWVGWCSGNRPLLYLRGKQPAVEVAQANQLTWWLRHRQRVFLPQTLRSSCGNCRCVNPEHRHVFNRVRARRWNVREVRELREIYWGTNEVKGVRARAVRRADAITRTAHKLGVKRITISRFLAGKHQMTRWGSDAGSPEDVRRKYEECVLDAERDRRIVVKSVSMNKMAREQGVALTTMLKMLTGQSYKSAGGPTSEVRKASFAIHLQKRGVSSAV